METCKHCGASLKKYTRMCPHCGHSRFEPISPSKPKSSFLFKGLGVLITLMIIAVIIALIILVIRLVHTDIQFDFSTKKSERTIPQTQTQHIDVLSSSFSTHYMNANHVEGYRNFKRNRSQSQIEQQFGKPEKTFSIDGQKVYQYGDISIAYNNDKRVNHVFITPTNVMTHDFIQVHQRPDTDYGHFWYYDKNRGNGYTIKVYVQDGYIQAIENIPQI
ncbi:hypothetical protein [Staphylococcus ratti]|uniref:Zinc ribbon domain-containing protein n=1 Tax=Staphylococcus ratti TaxID=2892440 RepID=A0ABY3PDD8_9STAP|nr:hypothetical protein [Staphylococcus ratti]UEX90308.1 hypothetical protein LN051_01140 [Staphylococcus ratti]